jgi:hypothetical protein
MDDVEAPAVHSSGSGPAGAAPAAPPAAAAASFAAAVEAAPRAFFNAPMQPVRRGR